MLLWLFLLFIGLSVLIAVSRWRTGLFLCVLAGILQDPVRKVTPSASAWLTLSSVPVYFGAVLGMLVKERNVLVKFQERHRIVVSAMLIFVLSLLPGAVISATYGHGSWQFTLVGLFSYLTALCSIVVGYTYCVRHGDAGRLLGFYCVVTVVMLAGGPLEYLDVGSSWRVLGTSALETHWVREITGYKIRLIAGFFRSPDIMAWHAGTMAMVAVALSIRYRKAHMWVWLACAAWGLIGVMLCGRRKAIMLLPIFAAMMLLIHMRRRSSATRTVILGWVMAVSVVGAYLFYDWIGQDEATKVYYFSRPNEVVERFTFHGHRNLVETYKQAGFWGAGLGMATVGAHRVAAARPRIWQEGGLSRLMVELGVPGFVCAVWLGIVLLRTCYRVVIRLDSRSPESPLLLGLSALLVAHACGFVVSHQVYGAPFVGLFLPLLIGFLLSGKETTLQGSGFPSRPNPPC